MADRLPDPLLERLRLGELPPDAATRAAADPTVEARMAALDADDAAFLEAHPPALVVPAIRRRATRERAARFAAFAVPALAALALWVVHRPPTDDGVRFKGAPMLMVYRQGPDGRAEQLPNGAHAGTGDLLQIAYAPDGAAYGAVVSLDGRGAVTLHSPPSADGSTALAAGPVTLPHAYELDDAPGFERFVLVTSDRPVPVPAVLEGARAVAGRSGAAEAPLPLPPGLAQRSFLLIKEARP
jgi:hypothetical protein